MDSSLSRIGLIPFSPSASSSTSDLTFIDLGSFDEDGATGAYVARLVGTGSASFASSSSFASQSQSGSLVQNQTASTQATAGGSSNLISQESTSYTPTSVLGVYSTHLEAHCQSSYSVQAGMTSAYQAANTTSGTVVVLAASGHAETNITETDAGVTTTGGDQGVYSYTEDGSSHDCFDYSSATNSTSTSTNSTTTTEDTFEVVDVATSSYTDDERIVYSGDELTGTYNSHSAATDTLTVHGQGKSETNSTYSSGGGCGSSRLTNTYDYLGKDEWSYSGGDGGTLSAAGAKGASGSTTTESVNWDYTTKARVKSSSVTPTSTINMGGVYTVTIPGSSSTSDSDYRKTDAGWSEAETTTWTVYDAEDEASGTISNGSWGTSWELTWVRSAASSNWLGDSSWSDTLERSGGTFHTRHVDTSWSDDGSSANSTSTDTSTEDVGSGPTTTTTTSAQSSTSGTPPTPPENPSECGAIKNEEWWADPAFEENVDDLAEVSEAAYEDLSSYLNDTQPTHNLAAYADAAVVQLTALTGPDDPNTPIISNLGPPAGGGESGGGSEGGETPPATTAGVPWYSYVPGVGYSFQVNPRPHVSASQENGAPGFWSLYWHYFTVEPTPRPETYPKPATGYPGQGLNMAVNDALEYFGLQPLGNVVVFGPPLPSASRVAAPATAEAALAASARQAASVLKPKTAYIGYVTPAGKVGFVEASAAMPGHQAAMQAGLIPQGSRGFSIVTNAEGQVSSMMTASTLNKGLPGYVLPDATQSAIRRGLPLAPGAPIGQ